MPVGSCSTVHELTNKQYIHMYVICNRIIVLLFFTLVNLTTGRDFVRNGALKEQLSLGLQNVSKIFNSSTRFTPVTAEVYFKPVKRGPLD